MSERMQLTHDDWYTMDLQDWMVMVNNYYDLVAKHDSYCERIRRAIATLLSQPIGLEDGPIITVNCCPSQANRYATPLTFWRGKNE